MNKISVCVPSYNRPEMMKQLVASFINQDYSNKELIISDDSTNKSVEEVAKKYKNQDVHIHKNKQNLGYSKNLLQAMLEATGQFVLILGDDDLLVSRHALSAYVSIFEKYPEVNYIYSNGVQFSNKLKIEHLTDIFYKDTYFNRGNDAMKGIWTTSVFIPGMGIRNNKELYKFYPTDNILFPQVELVGNIINQSDAFGISTYLIGGRAHKEQLGFYAIKEERIKGGERHGNVELFDIFKKLKLKYNLSITDDFLSESLINGSVIMLLKEKMIIGNRLMSKNYTNFCNVSRRAMGSKRLKFSYLMALILPAFIISIMRKLNIFLYRMEHAKSIASLEGELNEIVSIKL